METKIYYYLALLLVVDRHKLTVFYLKSFDMDSVQVGKAVFGKEIHTTLGIEPRTNSNPGRYGNPYSVCWFKKKILNRITRLWPHTFATGGGAASWSCSWTCRALCGRNQTI